MRDNKLKYAIIGCGIISSAHAEGVSLCPDAELYAVCDIIEEKAISLMKKYGAKMYFTDYREMLKLKEIDIVSICTPSGLHGDMTIDCANAGKHVLCEKPLDIVSEKLDRMIEACGRNKVNLGAVFQYRTQTGFKNARKMLQEGKLGKILIANGYGKEYRSPEYYKSAGWRGTWALDGGGCLMNQNVHCMDVLCWLAGDVESIMAKTYTLARDIEVEDSAFALLQFKNGAKGTFEGSTIFYPGKDDLVEIQCEKGRIIYDSGETLLYTMENDEIIKTSLDGGEVEKDGAANNPEAISAKGHTYFVSDIVRSVIEGREPYITGRSARKAVDVILSIYESSKTGREVFLKM